MFYTYLDGEAVSELIQSNKSIQSILRVGTEQEMLDYGYRSSCCYAPIRLGKKLTKSGLKIRIWICVKCKKRDVNLVEYKGKDHLASTSEIEGTSKFIPEEDV